MSYKPLTDATLQALVAKNNVMQVSGYEVDILIEQSRRGNALEAAAEELRVAQRAYMADRGNNELGKRVAETAGNLDKALASFRATN